MKEELVSILTPAYNAKKTIAETIQSVQLQSYTNWEMLIVDDGSQDGIADLVARFASSDPRIHLIRQPNLGPAIARQNGLDHARGRYIAFLDSDDLWLPDKLERQLVFMSDVKASFSYTAYRRIKAFGNELGHLIKVPEKMTYRRLLGNTAIATSTVMIDRLITGEFKMINTYYDDFVLWLELLKRGCITRGLQMDLMRYRVVENSVSRNKFQSAKMVWKTYRDIECLPAPLAAWYFVNYSFNAWRKYRIF